MTFEEDVELIAGYNDWVLERKRMATDLTPEAYLADRMRQDASDRVIKAVEYIENQGGKWDDDAGMYWKAGQPAWQPKTKDMRSVERILRGDL